MNDLINEEIENICNDLLIIKDKFVNKSFLITGGTGFIGSYILKVLSRFSEKNKLVMQIYGMTRDYEKARQFNFSKDINFIFQDMKNEIVIENCVNIDYIIHTASPTDSSYFINHPVELINDTILGMNNVMNFAIKSKAKSVIFLSSMEVYGICKNNEFITENQYYSIDCTNVRNSYSEGKKILECLSISFFHEYNVPVKIVRLGQCFGPGISVNDNRVFAQFAKCIKNNRNIILSTKGETTRSYCSIRDCLFGIFLTLFNGASGEAYNLVSDNSYCSIFELAKLFIKDTKLNIEIVEKEDNKYLETIKFGLDNSKIKKLGFISKENIDSMVYKLIKYFKYIEK